MKRKSRQKFERAANRQRSHAPKGSSARAKYERYLALARAEDGNGDPVAAQNYYQHAEHYLRASNGSATDVPFKA